MTTAVGRGDSADAAPRATAPAKLADGAYARLKQDIFDFRLVPGDRFSEAEVAEKLGISRTPVREALFRLQREGYLDVTARSGWIVRPFDFEQFEHLYDLRMVLETTAVMRLCRRQDDAASNQASALAALAAIWLVERADRIDDGRRVAEHDEVFHMELVRAAGNPELARVHREVTERIRIIRRLDFTQPKRVETTYDEHARILEAIVAHDADEATRLLRLHIEDSKAEVRKITLHSLHAASRMPLRTPLI